MSRAVAIADQSAYRRDTPAWDFVRALAARHLLDMSCDTAKYLAAIAEAELRKLVAKS
jgi:hypothetical protein